MHMQYFTKSYLEKRILSSGGLFSVESIPGSAAATRLNNCQKTRKMFLNCYYTTTVVNNTNGIWL